MSATALEPEFLNTDAADEAIAFTSARSPNRIDELPNDNLSALSNTVSFCSNFSRVGIDKVLYRDILKKRKEHAMFTALEKEDERDDRRWYYIDDKDSSIVGPLTAAEMDQRFQLEVFRENTKVKKKFEEEYYPLSTIVKRYYKNVLSEKLDLQKGPEPLSNKLVNFRKGETMGKRGKDREIFEQKNRDQRVFSQLVRPQLNLRNMLPAGEGEDDDEPYARLRANTLNQNSERPRVNTAASRLNPNTRPAEPSKFK